MPSFNREVIATWYREVDGVEFHLRRDGTAFWKFPWGFTWEMVGVATFESVYPWAEVHQYERVDLIIECDE